MRLLWRRRRVWPLPPLIMRYEDEIPTCLLPRRFPANFPQSRGLLRRSYRHQVLWCVDQVSVPSMPRNTTRSVICTRYLAFDALQGELSNLRPFTA